jgi:hypothetical protein
MASKVYSPRELVLIVNGAPVRGWNSIELTLPNNRWVMEHDSTGDGLFIENSAYKYFEMTVNTSQQSEANIALSGVYADGTTSGLLLTDPNGTTVFAAGKCKVSLQSAPFAKDAGSDRGWQIIGNYDACVIGGNTDA